jgi:peroxiredoxin
MFLPGAHLHMNFRAAIVLISVLLLSGCETPERRSALERMDRMQAENSAIKAKAESESAQARVEIVRQRSDDLRVIEMLTARIDALNAKIDGVQSQAHNDGPKPGPETEPAKPPAPAISAEDKAEIEKTKEEMRKQLQQSEEMLAKAQARIEAAEAAAKAAAAGPKDAQASREWKGKKLPLTKFLDSSGALNNLADYVGKKTVVMCVMKGFYSQGVCVYCTRQTADLARAMPDFQKLNTEVVVVYPGGQDHISTFVKTVRDYEKSDDPRFHLPFKVLLDVDQDVVKALGISGDLAHPTTFVIGKDGVVVFQYTGRTISDRPAAKDILDEVKKLESAKP